MIITKIFRFEAAHKLVEYDGPCSKLHGHTYVLHVRVMGNINSSGFVMDFKDLKTVVNSEVISFLDHSYLNDLIGQPSAENIALWIMERLKGKLPLHEIVLFETPDSYVTMKADTYESE